MNFPKEYLDIATPLGEKILTWARPEGWLANAHPQAVSLLIIDYIYYIFDIFDNIYIIYLIFNYLYLM
jgi:hypothetical protein